MWSCTVADIKVIKTRGEASGSRVTRFKENDAKTGIEREREGERGKREAEVLDVSSTGIELISRISPWRLFAPTLILPTQRVITILIVSHEKFERPAYPLRARLFLGHRQCSTPNLFCRWEFASNFAPLSTRRRRRRTRQIIRRSYFSNDRQRRIVAISLFKETS